MNCCSVSVRVCFGAEVGNSRVHMCVRVRLPLCVREQVNVCVVCMCVCVCVCVLQPDLHWMENMPAEHSDQL